MARSSMGPPAPGKGKPGDKGKAGNWFAKHKMETYAGAGVGGLLLLLYFKSHQSPAASQKSAHGVRFAGFDVLERRTSGLQRQHGPHGRKPTPNPPPPKGKPPTRKGHCPPGFFWDPDDNDGKGRCVKKKGHKGPDHATARGGSLLQANRGPTSGARPTNLVTSIDHTLETITRPTAIKGKKEKRRPIAAAPIRRINKPIRRAV